MPVFEESPHSVDMYMAPISMDALLCLSMDPEVSERLTWEAWVAWMQACEALFAMGAAEPGESFERLMHHEVRTLKAEKPGSMYDVSTWLDAVFLAMTCRDRDRVHALAQIPVPVLRQWSESGGSVGPEFIWPWAEAVQDFVLGRDSLGQNLAEAMRLCEPEHLQVMDPQDVQRITLPQMKVLGRLAARDTEGFNEQMYRGLVGFRDYHTQDFGEDDSAGRESAGMVPLDLFALACVAHDLHRMEPSFVPDLSSTYFPRKILERAWEDEFAYRAHIPDPVDPQALARRYKVGQAPPLEPGPDVVAMVERHEAFPPRRAHTRELEVEVVDGLLDAAQRDPERVVEAYRELREWALAGVADDPWGAELLTYLPWAAWAQVGHVLFRAGVAPQEGPVRVGVLGEQRSFGPLEPGAGLDMRVWVETFCLALTCRLEEVVPDLALQPISEVRQSIEARGVVEDEFVYAWAEALQRFIVNRSAVAAKVEEALRLATPEHARSRGAEELRCLAVPPMKVLLRLAEKDSEGFNGAMREALELFRAYYTATGERRSSYGGVVPLELFALACVAYDLRRDVGFDPDLSST